MAVSKIIIRGIPEKAPRISDTGDVVLIFKIPVDKLSISNSSTNTSSTDNSSTDNSYYRVFVEKALWKKVSREINESTYYIIEGLPKASVSSKGLPFLSVLCIDVKVINGFLEDESSPGSFKFPGELPENTEAVIPISSITIPGNINEPNTAKTRAFNYFKRHGTFQNAIVVKKDTMTLVSGYANYLLAKDLNIEIVPVSYNLMTGTPSKDEYAIKRILWYIPEEVTELNVKDILLTEDVHLNVQNFVFSINLKEIFKSKLIDTPISVRPTSDGKYSLVTGAARYFAAKILDIEKIPAVITDMTHDEFLENRIMKHRNDNDSIDKENKAADNKKAGAAAKNEGETLLSLITIPEAFARTRPRLEKIKESMDYYKKHGKFDKPVVIKGDSNLLIDGYKRYVAAKELGLKSIWTIKVR